MPSRVIGVLGARSLVGDCLLASEPGQVLDADIDYIAFSRRSLASQPAQGPRVTWCRLAEDALSTESRSIEQWICLMPIWALPDYFPLLERLGVRRIVALSSTSRFTKAASADHRERKIATALAAGERQLIDWSDERGVVWIILRPTLIYGLGRDENIASIAEFIRRYGFFPLFGSARGRRQPIHARDVATACLQALSHAQVGNQAYNLSGAETLIYREMVRRVFEAMGRKTHFLPIPRFGLRAMVTLARLLPRFRDISVDMAERMNRDQIFDHSDAARDFYFKPGAFNLSKTDVA